MYGIIFLGIFLILAIPVCIIDIRHLKIPLIYMYSIFALAICYEFFFRREYIVLEIIGAVILFFVFLLVWIFTRRGLGFGDVQLSLVCGFFNGFPFAIVAIFISTLLGLFYFGIVYARNKTSVKDKKVPFAPFMLAGTFVILLVQVITGFFNIDLVQKILQL